MNTLLITLVILYLALSAACIYIFKLSIGSDEWNTNTRKWLIVMSFVPGVNIILLFIAIVGLEQQINKSIHLIHERMDSDPSNPFDEISMPEESVYRKILTQLT